jgi:nicotinamide phosphoribosyltransferase
MNPMLLIDGYKIDHRRQFPKGTTKVYSNWTPRTSRVEGQKEIVFFGLQYFLKHYMQDMMDFEFFVRPVSEVCDEYQQLIDGYLGPNDIGTDHIRALHDLGYVPLEFRALPEGTRCPLRVPCLTVENTHPDFFWLPNYFETIMSNALWMACTSATTAWRIRRMLDAAAAITGGDPDFVGWQGHDFSMRGLSGLEAAQLSGAAHLLSFTGTDTIPALPFIEKYYHGEHGNGLVGGSVPATEHSVMSAGGDESELDTFGRLLDLYPKGIVSVVSDTWDLWKVIANVLPKLKDRIMARDGKLVIRPDSGNPADILCGTDTKKGVVELLGEIFGGTKTSYGFKQLDPHIGVIYGDAINYDRAMEIVSRLQVKGFASTNVVFGIGSYNYQYVTRDTYGFAMKATWAEINGKAVDLYKTPATDDGVKNSARGRLAVLKGRDGALMCVEQAPPEARWLNELKLVWRDGKLYWDDSFDRIRARLRA